MQKIRISDLLLRSVTKHIVQLLVNCLKWVELITLGILKFLSIKSMDIRIFPLFLIVSITSTEKIWKLFWLVNQYQLSQRETSEAAGDDPRGGREHMRVCFNMMVSVPSENIMLMALFHALRKPCCGREPSKLNKLLHLCWISSSWDQLLHHSGLLLNLYIILKWHFHSISNKVILINRWKSFILGVFLVVFRQ